MNQDHDPRSLEVGWFRPFEISDSQKGVTGPDDVPYFRHGVHSALDRKQRYRPPEGQYVFSRLIRIGVEENEMVQDGHVQNRIR